MNILKQCCFGDEPDSIELHVGISCCNGESNTEPKDTFKRVFRSRKGRQFYESSNSEKSAVEQATQTPWETGSGTQIETN